MATLRSTPTAWLSDGYKRPWRDGNHTAVVTLEPPTGGHWRVGTFTMPRKLAEAAPHTNEWLAGHRWIADKIDRWGQWMERTGWYAVRPLEYLGYRNLPTPNVQTESDAELVEVHVRGLFTRHDPQYMSTDSFDAIRDVALRWGLAEDTPESLRLEHLPTVEEPVGPAPDHIVPDTPAHNPAQFAYEALASRGLKQRDLLIGTDPRTPLGEEKIK